jgi:hypothetical protein
MVYLEQPAGVGFSYSSLTTDNELLSNDYVASEDFVLTIRAFYARFPERANNTFSIASESYGGHYMPQLALKLLAEADLSPRFGGMLVGNPYTSYASGEVAGVTTMWGLQLIDLPLWSEFQREGCGDLAGSPYAISDVCFELMNMMYTEVRSLNLYALSFPVCSSAAPGYTNPNTHTNPNPNTRNSRTPYTLNTPRRTSDSEQAVSTDGVGVLSSAFGVYSTSSQAHQLVRLMGRLRTLRQNSTSASSSGSSSSGSRTSISSGSFSSSSSRISSSGNSGSSVRSSRSALAAAVAADGTEGDRPRPSRRELRTDFNTDGYWLAPVVPDGLAYNPCTESYALSYLNDPAVQQAMHVLPAERGRASVDFSFCSDEVFTSWSLMDSYSDTTKLYTRILEQATAREEETGRAFNILVFSGDSDGVCGTVGTQHWIYRVADDAGRDQVRLWQPWLMDGGAGQQGGFLTQFEGNFSFATVHAAGHEVPAYQPKAALALFAGYLDGSIFAQRNLSTVASTPAPDGQGDAQAKAVRTTVAITVSLVLAFILLLVGYFIYARRRLQYAQRMSLDAAGLQAFADVDSADGDEEEPQQKARGGTRNPMSPMASSSTQRPSHPVSASALQSTQEVLI